MSGTQLLFSPLTKVNDNVFEELSENKQHNNLEKAWGKIETLSHKKIRTVKLLTEEGLSTFTEVDDATLIDNNEAIYVQYRKRLEVTRRSYKEKELNDLIEREKNKKKDFLAEIDPKNVNTIVGDLIDYSLSINYNKIDVEITPIETILFKFLFVIYNDKIAIYVDKPFHITEEVGQNQAVLSVVKNNEALLVEVQDLKTIFEKLATICSVYQ